MSRRPCLMFVLGLAPQKIGGMEKFLRYFVMALDEVGWDAVLCFDGPISPVFREYIDRPSVTLETLLRQEHLGRGAAGELRGLLKQYKPAVFVYAFHGVMRVFPWLARLAGCRRIFFNDHSSRPWGQGLQRLSLPKRVVGRMLTAPLTGIVSVADFTRRTGRALGVSAAPNVVVSNGVEMARLDPEMGRAFRARWGIGADEVVVTQVCWMVPEKGVDVLLAAAAQMLETTRAEGAGGARVRFVLVGDGPQLDEYKEQARSLGIAEAVLFTGLVMNPTASGLFGATDVYCQPSVWQEACPLAVLEAMSWKLPVVASDTGGLPELVEDGISGRLVGVRDSVGLARALGEMVADAELRTSMGEAGSETIEREHRIDAVARRYVEIFVGGVGDGTGMEVR